MNQLLEWDKKLFFLINHSGVNDFFDAVMPWVRDAKNWIPLYILLVAFASIKFQKKGLFWVLFAAIAVIACNFISSDIIKELIWRTRPCRDSCRCRWGRRHLTGATAPQLGTRDG